MHLSDYSNTFFCLYFFLPGIYIQSCVFSGFIHRWWSYGCRGNMGTQGSGRKRAPLKDRFSAEDEALSSIAREVSSYADTYIVFFHFGA